MIVRLKKAWQALMAHDNNTDFGGTWHPATGLNERFSKNASGETVTPQTAMTLSAYYAAIRCIAEDVAKLPLPVYRNMEPRGKEKVRGHAVAKLLNREPNKEMTAMSFRETITAMALGWGGGFAEIQRRGMEPVALWPIHASRVTIARGGDGSIVYRVRNDDDSMTPLTPMQVFHIHGLGGDGLNGWSVAKLGADSLGLAMAAQKMGGAFFANGTNIGGILEHPGNLSEEGADNLRRSWHQRYAGADKSAQVLILEEGMKFQKLGIPPDDAQFLETRQFQVEEIARWFRIPPHKIQHLANATFSNIESQAIEYVQDCLMPWMIRWEQEVQRKLLGVDAVEFSQHVVTSLLRGDQAARSTFYREQFNVGALSQNDIRELENMNPVEGGDTYYINGAMIPSHLAAEGVNVVQPTGTPRKSDDAEDIGGAMVPAFRAACDRVQAKATKGIDRAKAKYGDGEYRTWLQQFAESLRLDSESALFPVAYSMSQLASRAAGVDHRHDDVTRAVERFAESFVASLVGDGMEPDMTAQGLRDAIAGMYGEQR